MKKYLSAKSFYILSVLLMASCSGEKKNNDSSDSSALKGIHKIMIPTQVYENMADEESYEERRDNYFDLIHGMMTDWREVNKANFKAKYEERINNPTKTVMSYADGLLLGEWQERGSNDVAGNVRVVDYNQSTDILYAISDGGILWKGARDGSSWTTQNDYFLLDKHVLKVIDIPGGVRLLAAVGSQLKYSDDEGETWEDVAGLIANETSGRAIDLVQLNDADGTILYLYRKTFGTGGTGNFLYQSTDNGLNFDLVYDLTSSNANMASLACPFGSDQAYLIDGTNAIHKFEGGALTELVTSPAITAASRVQIEVNISGAGNTIYILGDSQTLFKSTDEGASFTEVSTLSPSSWDVGMQVSLDDPDVLYFGAVNIYRSTNGGVTFDVVSEWWEYYGDIANKIHADIMNITPFKTAIGEEFTVIPNHGGINISYDHLVSTPSIGLLDLNTGQFYDVLTDPNNSDFAYGGTQDQGFQRTSTANSPAVSGFNQLISGDYGSMQFSANGNLLWAQYPGGDYSLYVDPMTAGGPMEWFDIEGDDMPSYNWIIPSGPAPNPSDNFIYSAGGSLGGGPGSYLIKLTYTAGTGITGEELPFDFMGAVGSPISAIETTPANEDLIFVSTENGKFFKSTDAGMSFVQTTAFTGPGGWWIYGADIYASRTNENLVFLAGSDYGPSCVWMSTDGGDTFTALDNGMPNTTAHEIVMDPEEKFLFAATDAGPYVYSMELEEWFDISGNDAPIQIYMCVEYVEDQDLVRFGTYGRGIWDFSIISDVSTANETANVFNAYPNPVVGASFTLELANNELVQIFDLNGKLIFSKQLKQGNNVINTSEYKNGVYLLKIGNQTKKLIIS